MFSVQGCSVSEAVRNEEEILSDTFTVVVFGIAFGFCGTTAITAVTVVVT